MGTLEEKFRPSWTQIRKAEREIIRLKRRLDYLEARAARQIKYVDYVDKFDIIGA